MEMWGWMVSWFTPTSLFLFVNLAIATILLTSRNRNQDPPRLARTPSLLERVKSFDFSSYKYHPNDAVHSHDESHQQPSAEPAGHEDQRSPDSPHHISRSSSLLNRIKSMSFGSSPQPSSQAHCAVDRSKSESDRARNEDEDEDSEISERERPVPATTRVEKWSDKYRPGETSAFGDDREVDAKADDFINRFRQQLRLQRLDSLKRFGEMLKMGKQT